MLTKIREGLYIDLDKVSFVESVDRYRPVEGSPAHERYLHTIIDGNDRQFTGDDIKLVTDALFPNEVLKTCYLCEKECCTDKTVIHQPICHDCFLQYDGYMDWNNVWEVVKNKFDKSNEEIEC